MQVHITRPVVIATDKGMRHLAAGLTVELNENEMAQVVRQGACATESKGKAAKTKAAPKQEETTEADKEAPAADA